MAKPLPAKAGIDIMPPILLAAACQRAILVDNRTANNEKRSLSYLFRNAALGKLSQI